ncbi:hypothetical protein BpHYR1_046529 [Brachionus plicatilis]|uniref:Uncharacterized protein n=1 Tax=Brachionus plicatilis TaxID=10195 RepID=A0A3M7Q2B0_BRAPC|nr:hypothetical protein BpHYR1_046529 [Brachionus plicatilis]
MQIEFFERLLENEFTKSIIKELLNVENDKDYISNTLDLLNEIEFESSMDLIDKCKYYGYVTELEFETSKKNNTVFEELKKVFNKQERQTESIYVSMSFEKFKIRTETNKKKIEKFFNYKFVIKTLCNF